MLDVVKYIKSVNGPIHISFDVDALDPTLVDSTGTRVPEGLEPEDVSRIIASALEADKLVSLDVVEFNKALGNPENSLLAVKKVFDAELLTETESSSSMTETEEEEFRSSLKRMYRHI